MMNRVRTTVVLAGALLLLVGSTGLAAPADTATQVIAKVYRANGVIAKVQVAFDARDWPLLRSYVDEYVAMMRSVTAQVKDLVARGENAKPSFDAVQHATVKHLATLKKIQGRAPTKDVRDVLALAISASQSAYEASIEATTRTVGR